MIQFEWLCTLEGMTLCLLNISFKSPLIVPSILQPFQNVKQHLSKLTAQCNATKFNFGVSDLSVSETLLYTIALNA